MGFHFVRRFTDSSQEVGDRTIDVPDDHVGLRFKAAVPGRAWEIREIIANNKPLRTVIAELIDDNDAG